jgi:hypothetical protein
MQKEVMCKKKNRNEAGARLGVLKKTVRFYSPGVLDSRINEQNTAKILGWIEREKMKENYRTETAVAPRQTRAVLGDTDRKRKQKCETKKPFPKTCQFGFHRNQNKLHLSFEIILGAKYMATRTLFRHYGGAERISLHGTRQTDLFRCH